MILIITHKEDYTADFLINKFNERRILYYRLNCEDIFNKPLSIRYDNKLNLTLDKYSSFKSIWFRRTKIPTVNIENNSDRVYINNEFDIFLKNLITILKGKWLSHPEYVYKAENKLWQLKIATEIGFEIPDTLVTSEKKDLIEFILIHQKVAIKPIGFSVIDGENKNKFIFTNVITSNDLKSLESYDLTPCIYQKYIEKDFEIRITIVGKEVFAFKIDSQKNQESHIDWRKGDNYFESYILPEKIKDKCLQLTVLMNLDFAAIDMIKTKNDEFYFLEINPNGQWAWLEIQTGVPISESIIQFLLN